MKNLIISITLLFMIGNSLRAQENVAFRFANIKILKGSPSFLQFDIEMKASSLSTYHSDLQVYLDYNTAAFGENVQLNRKINLEKLNLLEGQIEGKDKYSIIVVADSKKDRVAFMTEFATEIDKSGPGYYNLVPDQFTGLVRIRLEIKDPGQKAGISFVEELMKSGQYYVVKNGNPTEYDQCTFENSLAGQSLN